VTPVNIIAAAATKKYMGKFIVVAMINKMHGKN
jgi:hypothetical protein